MNRKLIEHLYRQKFHLEGRVQELKDVKNFDSEHSSAMLDQELGATQGRLNFVNETLDIVFEEAGR